LDGLDAAGREALAQAGVRTIIDLRNDDERAAAAPGSVHLPLDAAEDTEFWDEWGRDWRFGTPLYYGPHLARHPDRSARVIAAIAHAPPGGVLFHCVGGRDRTGMIAMLVLALVGVPKDAIAADYARTAGPEHAHAIRDALDGVDLDALVAKHDREALTKRLVEKTNGPG
jgi:protein tyrosine/serine phosphatase